jgi:hypothetical protein
VLAATTKQKQMKLKQLERVMIKRMGILGIAALMLILTTENESYGQGFGGFYRGRNVYARGVGYGGIVGVRYPSVGYGYGYGNVGNPYGAVGGVTTVGGMRVGGNRSSASPAVKLAIADMALAGRNNRPAPTGPAPGPGPAGIASIGDEAGDKQPDSRSSALAALNASLKQTALPGDAGLPPTGGGK